MNELNPFPPLTTVIHNCAPCHVCGCTERGAQAGGSRSQWCRNCYTWFPGAYAPICAGEAVREYEPPCGCVTPDQHCPACDTAARRTCKEAAGA